VKGKIKSMQRLLKMSEDAMKEMEVAYVKNVKALLEYEAHKTTTDQMMLHLLPQLSK